MSNNRSRRSGRSAVALGAAAAVALPIALIAAPSANAAPKVSDCNSVITTTEGFTAPGLDGRLLPCRIPYGSRGAVVKAMQNHLNQVPQVSARLTVDGSYGPTTRAAVRKYQSTWNILRCGSPTVGALAEDGRWGPKTSEVSYGVGHCDV